VPRVASPAAAHIGALISAERLRIGMTQDQLAAASGIDSSNIRAYENGRAMPSIQTLVRLAEGLGGSPAELLVGLRSDMFPVALEDRRRRAG